jgi:hypothetical protein
VFANYRFAINHDRFRFPLVPRRARSAAIILETVLVL